MSALNDKFLIELGNNLVEAIKSALATKDLTGYGPSVASGDLIKSIRSEVGDNELKIFGLAYIYQLQYGRKPTTGGTSDKPLKERIREWIDLKGIQPEDNISKDSLAYLIARKIHNEGTIIYQKNNGGSSGLLDDVLNDDLYTMIESKLRLAYIQTIKSEVLKNVPKEMLG